VADNLELAFGEPGVKLIGDRGKQGVEVGGLKVKGHLARLQFGQIEQVIEQGKEDAATGVDMLKVVEELIWGGSGGFLRPKLAKLRMQCRGVCSLWDILAKKVLLAWFAATAR